MSEEMKPYWDTKTEKLLCHMLLDDGIAAQISPLADAAFWRAFIVENRATQVITAKFRYKYKSGERSWYHISPSDQDATRRNQIVEELRCGLEDVLSTALTIFGFPVGAVQRSIHCFYPPDDGGDPGKTLIWLEQNDLVEIKSVELAEGN